MKVILFLLLTATPLAIAARMGKESRVGGRGRGAAPPCPECYRRLQGQCRRDTSCTTLAEMEKDCIGSYTGDISKVDARDTFGTVFGEDLCRTNGAGNIVCGKGALCCAKGFKPAQEGNSYVCPEGGSRRTTTAKPDKSTINGGNDPARQWDFKCRVGGSKTEGICDKRKPKSAPDSCRNCMYGKIKPHIWNDWCCTLQDYKKLNKFNNGGRCFCADEWTKWTEEAVGSALGETAEAFVASDAELTAEDYGIWALAIVGFGTTLYVAAVTAATAFSRLKNYEMQGLV